MRLLLFMLGISVGIIGIRNRAEAQNYPCCGVYRKGVMIFARSILFSNAWPLSAKQGSAFKIARTNRRRTTFVLLGRGPTSCATILRAQEPPG
jgi:hypothetical protein